MVVEGCVGGSGSECKRKEAGSDETEGPYSRFLLATRSTRFFLRMFLDNDGWMTTNCTLRREGGIWRGKNSKRPTVSPTPYANKQREQSYRDIIQRIPSNVELRTNEGEHNSEKSEGSQAQLGGSGRERL